MKNCYKSHFINNHKNWNLAFSFDYNPLQNFHIPLPEDKQKYLTGSDSRVWNSWSWGCKFKPQLGVEITWNLFIKKERKYSGFESRTTPHVISETVGLVSPNSLVLFCFRRSFIKLCGFTGFLHRLHMEIK